MDGSLNVTNVIKRVLLYAVLILFAFIILIPFAWIMSASLKDNLKIFEYPVRWIPNPVVWKNYSDIWSKIPLKLYITNTAKLTIIVTIMQVLTSSLAAYPFAKMNFTGRNTLFAAYVSTIAIPWQVYMVPQFIMMSKFGLNNTHLALILMQSFTAFGVFLFRQFYISIPEELSEAARIDGLSEFGILRRVILPLSTPAVATLIIFTFVNTWNDYMGPMIYLTSDSLKTIQIGMRAFVTQYAIEYAPIMAAGLITMIPIFVVYIFMQRYFIEGIATTGIKG